MKIIAPMQLGMVGLGRMGANMVRRLMKGAHDCMVYDWNAETVDSFRWWCSCLKRCRRCALARTQTEPPFKLTQLTVLLLFVVLGIVAPIRFRNEPIRAAYI